MGTCNIHHVPKTWKLRGSGLWGPEQTDVLKLILWYRKRQWRPQREVPTIEEQQDHYVLEFAIIWFTAGNIFIMGPVLWWAKKYRWPTTTTRGARPVLTDRRVLAGLSGSGSERADEELHVALCE